MEIPKKKVINGKEYEFVEKCNDKLYLYKDCNGFKTAFSKFDLGLANNNKIDKLLNRRGTKLNNTAIQGHRVLVYDKLENKEIIYASVSDAAKAISIPRTTLDKKIINRQWLYNRWFAEKIMD